MAEKKTKKDKVEATEAETAAKVTAQAQTEVAAAEAEKVVADTTVGETTNVDTKGEAEATVEAVESNVEAEVAAEASKTAEAKGTAKAGKRSAKSIKEAEEKQAKEERKAKVAEEGEKPAAKPAPKTRSKLERRGKKYRKAVEGLDFEREYSLTDAIELAVKASPVKFDATVELHINLGVDPRHADQNIRDNLVLPAGTGKNVRVAVFAEADDQAKAKAAGADIAANEDFLAQLDKGTIDFDILVATPAMMPKLGKYARMLGPKGLMPNPKSGTVTADVAKAVSEAKAGRVEYRVDSTGIVHLGIGKASFGTVKLQQNAQAVFASVKAAKPASIKGTYVKGIHITTTMGPGVKVVTTEV